MADYPQLLRHEPDDDLPQHESMFICKWCRRRIEGFGPGNFVPGGGRWFQPDICPARRPIMLPNLTLVMTYNGAIDETIEAKIRALQEDLELMRAEDTYDPDRAIRRVVLRWPTQEEANAPTE
jgi:hypothetical protein